MSTLIVPTDYPTIQSAVDAAQQGDTIQVLPGIYNENVIVNQSRITLEATNNVILDGLDKTGTGILINGESVTVRDFTIINYLLGIMMEGDNCRVKLCYLMYNAGFGVHLDADNCTIEESKFIENGSGLDIAGDSNNIYNNGFLNNTLGGIMNSNNLLTNTIIVRNDLEDNPYGFAFTLAASTGNSIIGNMITADTGILLEAMESEITRNVLRKCTTTGMLINSTENEIYANQITGSENGIQIAQDENDIKKNAIGTSLEAGVTVLSDENKIEYNIITGCKMGIQMVGDDNKMKHNKFHDNEKNYMVTGDED